MSRGLIVLVLSAPLAFVFAIVSFPFWSWIERTFAVEAVGHSGPADWCFLVSYGLVAGALTWATRGRS